MKTDQRVQQDVIEELHGVAVKADAQNILVEVRGSDIFLTGTVHTWPERELARRSAWNTPGVRNVYDNISVTN